MTAKDLKQFCAKIMQVCFDITGKGQVNENSVAFYARELNTLSEVQIKAAFNHYASEGVFPTVAQVRSHGGVKTDYKESPTNNEGRTFEQKLKEQTAKLTPHTAYDFLTPYALEVWAPDSISEERDALEYFKSVAKSYESHNIYLDPYYSRRIVPERVTCENEIISGNKVITAQFKKFKAMFVCRNCRTDDERLLIITIRNKLEQLEKELINNIVESN